MRRLAWVMAATLPFVGCGGDTVVEPLSARGAIVAQDPRASGSQYNRFSCMTCHVVRPAEAGNRILPGAPLEGAARRPTYWNGETTHLREAVSRCWVHFMRGQPEGLDTPDGEAIYAWLESLSPEGATAGTSAVTYTWPRTARDLGDGGDRTRGVAVYQRACANCHGALGTAAGRLGPLVTPLPDDTTTEHCMGELPITVPDHASYVRQVVYQKTRHGSFLGYAGSMPPFSEEVLSDADLRDVVALFRCP